ncbi:MAG: lipopolysaccharide biosynthesis protein [Bacteroidales bacterium]|nr:lipopolysaccharide biosynthesis protein [Bacteroidales bacterium]
MGIIIRQSIKGTLVNYIGVCIGFFTTFFVLTRFLTAEEIGLTRVLVDASTLFVGLAQMGTSSSIVRFYPYFKDESKGDNGFFFWTVLVPLIGFVVFGLMFWGLKDYVCARFAEKSGLFVTYYKCVYPMAFAMLYMTVSESNCNVLMRIVVPKFVREVLVRLLTLAVYLLYAFGTLGIDGFVYGFCGVYVVALLVDMAYLFSLKKISLKPDWKFLTPQLKSNYLYYTLFLLTSTIATVLAPFANTYFISAEMGLAFTGIFAIATYITALVEIPYRSLGAISLPQLSASIKENEMAEANGLCKRISVNQMLVGGFVFLLIWVNLDLFFRLLPNGEQYAVAKWVVFILGMSKLFTSVFSISLAALSFSRYYYYSLLFSLVFTASALYFNSKFIPLWGMNGAALATLLSSMLYYGLLILLDWFKIKVSPLSAKHFGVLAMFALLLAADELWRYAFPVSGSVWWQLCESALRTSVLLSVGVFVAYSMRFSEDINQLLKRIKDEIQF